MANNYLSNVPGAVPYVSMVNDQANALLVNALNERTKQYEQQINAIAENEALLSQMKFRDPDRPGMLVRAAKIASDLDKEIQDKYAGDYAATGARKAVARRLAQERGAFQTAQQKYEEEQPYKQMYQQFKMTGQLAKKKNPITGKIEEVNPFSQALVDTEGRLLPTTIDYGDIRKKGDYVDYISKTIVDPLNKRMKDLGLRYTKGPFYGTKTSIQGKQVGMSPEEAAATVDDNVAKRFLEENPTFAFEYGADVESAKNYIKDIVRQKAIQQTDYQYGNITDPLAGLKYKASLQKQPDSTPSVFLPASKERGEQNPFITARQQKGETLQDLYKQSINRDYGSPTKTLKEFDAGIANLKKQQVEMASKFGTRPEALAEINKQIESLTNRRQTFLRYNNEMAERKTNWLNQAAQSITGNPEAKYGKISMEQRRKIWENMPKSEALWAKMFDEDLDGKTLTTRTQRALDPTLQKFIGEGIAYSGNYFRSSKGGTVSKNFDDVVKEAGIDGLALKQAIQTRAFPIHRLDATGEYAVRIPKDLKINASGKLDYKKAGTDDAVTLYFTFDEATRQMSEMLRWAEQSRFETGKKTKSFDTPLGTMKITKTKQPNIYDINGNLYTKDQMEQILLKASDEYIKDRYKVYLPSKKLNQPTEEYIED